ncbi:MAG: glycosyltransferase family 4 protein [Desulfobacteraceae bacterium]|nr:glycosyltransferase family 4 protein [Desulfobacteraceae bacterium]
MKNYRVLCLTDQSDLPETELFIRLKKVGVDIEVACSPKGRNFRQINTSDVPVHELIAESRFSPKSIRKIRRILNQQNYDILYCFNNKAASNLLLATRGEKKYKIITYRGTVGNVSFLSPASWTTHLNPRVSRIVCVSEAVRRHLINMRFLGLKIPPERAVTIYKGHDPSWYQSTPIDLQGEFNIPENAFVVGFAGRNRPHKGIDHLIGAARHLPADENIHFLLLGRLTGDQSLQKKIAQNPYKSRIHLAGFREDAPAVFAACDAFIMPSTKREGLSRAVIEAMVQATTPIVTNVGGLPELVLHNQSGIVVPPEDAGAIARAILKLHTDPAGKRRLGTNARQRIEDHFHIDQTVAQTRGLFESLIN